MKEWAFRYAGRFDDGWDAYRERVFERAKDKGWIPPGAELTARHPDMAAWDDIPEDEKPFQRRLMEVAAGSPNTVMFRSVPSSTRWSGSATARTP